MTRSNRKEWEKTFDAIDDWICIIDLKSKIYRSNLTAEKLFGLKIQKIIGEKCCSLAHGTESPVVECPLPKMIKTGKRESSELQIQDGRWMLITVDPLFNDDGDMTGAVHIARDITKQDWLERGMFIHYTFERNSNNLSTQVQMTIQHSAAVPAATKVFLVAHYRKLVEITTANGSVQSVRSLDR